MLLKQVFQYRRSVVLGKSLARPLSSSQPERKGMLERKFGLESNTGSSETNRWKMFVPAFCTHVCLGAPYGWSAITAQLTRENGLVSSAASDWALDLASYPMSIMMAAGGISAALLGKLSLRLGVRKSLACGALLYGAGFGVAAAGVSSHSLGLLYLGNLVTGAGAGLCYTPPIQVCLDWFPDRKGLASGIVIAGYGSGAMFFTPMMGLLTSKLSSLPTYLGSDVNVITEGGRQFAQVGGQLREAVFATSSDLLRLPYEGLAEGFYQVGSGNTGVAASLLTIGTFYSTIILASSLMIVRPPQGWLPAGFSPPMTEGGTASVHVDKLFSTPQFWLLFSTSTLLTMGGMGIMSVAKPMIQSVFADAMPGLVTTSFASGYLMTLASANWAGRLGWAALSDKIGRRNTFHLYTIGSVPIFGSIPFLINQCVSNPSGPLANIYLGAFCLSTVAAISVLGGVFSVLPAYEADLYGPKYVGPIHGRFLLAAAVSTTLGPALILNIRKVAEAQALADLLSKVDPQAFLDKFGVDLSSAQSLIEAKTLTISKLMTIMPPGTLDPSPFLYNNTMYTMAGLVSVASLLHLFVKPVNKKYFEEVQNKS